MSCVGHIHVNFEDIEPDAGKEDIEPDAKKRRTFCTNEERQLNDYIADFHASSGSSLDPAALPLSI